MRPRDAAELIVLAALWGGSFLFMRLAVPAFGPVAVAALRVAGASLMLLPLLALRGEFGALLKHWRPIAVVGLTNSALPFLAFAYAAISIDSGVLAIFNSATPLFAAVIAWLWLADRMTPWRVVGLGIGFAGVVWIAAYKAGLHGGGTVWAILACLGATLCYGVSPSLTKRYLGGVAPLAVATGSQVAASAFLAVPAAFAWPTVAPAAALWLVIAALAFFCTGLAYILYFRLIANAGPTNAVTVTYLVPIFAVTWGGLFLGETLTWPLVAGCAVVFAGTALATGILRPRLAPPRPKQA
ncbi:MAG: DMT family transporter [Caldimonas sp.]